uniref:Methylglutaconyl-CoA hydratase, mitochondrial-like n=1 Tax=Saccoglossus kowalevskii TaxID=10224 RepID=A0ABM0MVA2_SACKO|nr:PREDICTED: methylglutaconyl-CoA hydratase, mitochondrial-like [Saccoglossus kowalevskii]
MYGLRTLLLPVRKLCSNLSKATELVGIQHLEGKHAGIAVISMSRRKHKNAINDEFVNLLQEVLDSVKFNEKLRALILKSNVPGTFCAGADLKYRATLPAEEIASASQKIKRVSTELKTFPVPVIAAIDGLALGGGLELALGCDMRVAAKDVSLGQPETTLALIPGAGGTQNLPRLIGEAKAKEMIFCDRRLSGEEAEKIGLVNYAVDQNDSGDAAYQKSLRIAEQILSKAPLAVKMAKKAINNGLNVDLNTGLVIETACYAQIIPTEDRLEGLRAFIEKRTPEYKGK